MNIKKLDDTRTNSDDNNKLLLTDENCWAPAITPENLYKIVKKINEIIESVNEIKDQLHYLNLKGPEDE